MCEKQALHQVQLVRRSPTARSRLLMAPAYAFGGVKWLRRSMGTDQCPADRAEETRVRENPRAATTLRNRDAETRSATETGGARACADGRRDWQTWRSPIGTDDATRISRQLRLPLNLLEAESLLDLKHRFSARPVHSTGPLRLATYVPAFCAAPVWI